MPDPAPGTRLFAGRAEQPHTRGSDSVQLLQLCNTFSDDAGCPLAVSVIMAECLNHVGGPDENPILENAADSATHAELLCLVRVRHDKSFPCSVRYGSAQPHTPETAPGCFKVGAPCTSNIFLPNLNRLDIDQSDQSLVIASCMFPKSALHHNLRRRCSTSPGPARAGAVRP